jgi:hypothetical protein
LISARAARAYREKFHEETLSDPRYHEAAPKDMVGWLKNHPYLRTTHSSPIVVGDAHGERFDASVTVPHRLEADGEQACLPLFYYGVTGQDEWFAPCEGMVIRVIVLDTSGETIVISIIGAGVDDLNSFLPKAKHVLDTVRWGK